MVLYILKFTCFRAIFKLIIVRRYITNESVYQLVGEERLRRAPPYDGPPRF